MGEVQYAQNQPLTEERIRSQMEKLGNTEYEWENLEIQMDENIFTPMKMLNEARREALESLEMNCSNHIREKKIMGRNAYQRMPEEKQIRQSRKIFRFIFPVKKNPLHWRYIKERGYMECI